MTGNIKLKHCTDEEINMENLKTALKNKNLEHLYFFLGEETYLSNYYLDAVKKALKCDENFDYIRIDSENVMGLQDAVESVPVMSEKKLVAVTGIDFSNEIKSAETEYVAQILENVPTYTCVVFLCRAIKKNSKIYKVLSEKCKTCLFDYQKPQDVIRWLIKVAQNKNSSMSRDTAALLIEYCGVDMTTLNNEMDKISAYCVSDGIITDDAIEKIVIKSVEAKIYYLLDAIFSGQSREVFSLLREFEAENEKPIYINASIMGTIKTLLEYIYMSEEGKSGGAISDKLRLRPIQAKKYAGYMKKIDKRFLENMLKRCIDLDMQMKRGADGFNGLSLISGEMLAKTKK